MISRLSVIGLCLIILQTQATPEEKLGNQFIKKSVNKFTKDFLELISKDVYMINDNFANSGLSTWLGLYLIYNGAGGKTKEQIGKVLFDQNAYTKLNNPQDIIRAQTDFVGELKSDSRINLLINKIFVDNKIELKSKFKSDIAGYKSSSESIDFSVADKATKYINKWVDEQTNSTIRDVIMPSELSPLTKIVLVNIIKFKASWQKPFDKFFTSLADFYLHNGKAVRVQTMQNEIHCLEGSIEEVSADFIQIPFSEETDSSETNEDEDLDNFAYMTIIFPRLSSNVSHVEKNLHSLNLLQILRTRSHKKYLKISLPKFKIETEINLVDPMKNLGMTDMFSSAADFSEISEMPLQMSTISQKLIFDINENGISSAAATAMTMSFRSLPEKEYKINRPFLAFIIRKNVILFSARMFDPRV